MVWVWLLRAGWLSLPGTFGPLLSDALDGTGRGTRLAIVIGCWALWALVLVGTLVPHPLSLTGVRVAAPAAVGAALWATLADSVTGWAALALAITLATALVSLLPAVAAVFVDGASYGDERRMPLRPPAPLLLGPLQLAWAVVVVGAVAGPMLLAHQRWIAGTVVTVVGLAAAAVAARALHALARRWIVFVPAGMVLHDAMALREPVLFRRESIELLGPALAGTAADDLTLGAPGLALECRLRGPVEIGDAPRRGGAAPQLRAVEGFLFSPSQPGELLAEAERRSIAVG